MTPLSSAVASAAQQAAQAWRAAMQQQKKPCVMAPWQEFTYFEQPLSNVFTITPGTDFLIAQSNPSRVGIIMSADSPSIVGVLVRPGQSIDPITPIGINLPGNGIPISFLQKDWGNMVQVEWHAFDRSNTSRVMVVEVILRDWPKV